MIVFPNAKINIGLRVLERLQNGFHRIETVFLPIGLFDILEFVDHTVRKTHLSITGIAIDENPDNNLVIKAWELMHSKYNIPALEISLHKIVPIGAGLGGGSADAAFMLNGLNIYYNCGASVTELMHMAAQLGSDCSFFIINRPAYATGRGEILEEIELSLSGYKILLVNPGFMISTKDAYANVIPSRYADSLKDLVMQPLSKWQGLITNDFEGSVFTKYPEIERIRQKMIDHGAVYASMSGSGSTVFGIFKDTKEFNPLLREFKNYFVWQGRLDSVIR